MTQEIITQITDTVGTEVFGIWFLIGAAFVFFMQAGFAMVETGLTLTSYKLRGLVTFISDKCEPELMCVFTANEYIGELTECNEGELYWIDKAVVPTLPTWEGDRVFLDLLLSGDERFFSLKLQYEGEKLVDKQVNLY